jgi:hypothetical protein
MSKFKRRAATVAMFVTVMALTACGGGSSSSSGSGDSGGGSSTLVVNSSPSMAMLLRPHRQTEGITHIAATISKLLMRNAWAVPLAGSDVIVFNEFGGQITPTSGDTDMLYYVVPPGSYRVCVYAVPPDSPAPTDRECYVPQLVGSDEVVVVTAVPGVGVGDTDFIVDVETREENIALFENPERPNQTYICHKGKMTKSVGTPAALNGHQAHGDTLGPCPDFGPAQQNTNDGTNINNNNSNNNGNNGNDNRCNKGNKPKKGCPNEQV